MMVVELSLSGPCFIRRKNQLFLWISKVYCSSRLQKPYSSVDKFQSVLWFSVCTWVVLPQHVPLSMVAQHSWYEWSFSFRLNNPDSVKKRSKLVLPKPQISDTELEEVCTANCISYSVCNKYRLLVALKTKFNITCISLFYHARHLQYYWSQ